MAEKTEGQQFCKACGTPAGEGKLCEHCGQVMEPDQRGLVEDEGAAVRRVFESQDG